jgi:hypothetical protein
MAGKPLTISFLSLISLVLVGCRTPVFESQWPEGDIVIDGESTDWETVSSHGLGSLDATMGLCNNSEYLYLLLSIEEPLLTRGARAKGMALEFAGRDEKNLIFELHYSGGGAIQSVSEPRDSFWESLTPDQKKRYLSHQTEIMNMITIVERGRSVRIPPDGTQGISAARIDRPGLLGFELKIPLHEDAGKPYALGVDQGDRIHIGIRLGAEGSSEPSEATRSSGGIPAGLPMGGHRGLSPGASSTEKGEVHIQVILAKHEHVGVSSM